MKLRLSVISGPVKDKAKDSPVEFIEEIEEKDSFTVGRMDDCRFRLSGDPFLSKHHFLLEVDPAKVIMIDLGSKNGTKVNNTKYGGREGKETPEEAALRQERIILKNGDIIKIGKTEILVEYEIPESCANCGEEIPVDKLDESEVYDDVFLCSECRSADDRKDKSQNRENCGKVENKTVEPLTPEKKREIDEDPGGIVDLLIRKLFFSRGELDTKEYPEIMGYKIKKMLGKGGYGAVYLAVHENTGKQVALKTMLQTEKPTKKQIRQFHREIETLKKLKHKNIIRLEDYGNSDCIHYFAMEYIEGGSVWDLMENGDETVWKLPLEWAIPIMLQALEGLAYAHRQNQVHRDLKPANILLSGKDGDWKVKVADFGLAKDFEKAGFTSRTVETKGEFCGSPPYMAPEHIYNYKWVKPPTDVFEIAATFYHILTGKTVWDCSNEKEVHGIILNNSVKSIKEVEGSVSDRIAGVIDRALSLKPGERYQDAGEMLQALKTALNMGNKK